MDSWKRVKTAEKEGGKERETGELRGFPLSLALVSRAILRFKDLEQSLILTEGDKTKEKEDLHRVEVEGREGRKVEWGWKEGNGASSSFERWRV